MVLRTETETAEERMARRARMEVGNFMIAGLREVLRNCERTTTRMRLY